MSHELRTPLTSILGFAAVLGGENMTTAQTQHLQRITSSGETLLGVINDLITLTELDSGQITLDAAPFDPAELLMEELEAIEGQAIAKGLTLKLDIAEDAPRQVVGDKGRLKHVVGHYLSNALNFATQGDIAVTLTANGLGEAVSLGVSVRNAGPAVDPRVMEELFDRFTRADDGLRNSLSGRALGLAICKETIALMGGEVGVESQLGHGARFWFRVTLPLGADNDRLVAEAEERDANGQESSLRVLYADDHENNRLLVKTLLESQGHVCDLACDGSEAVKAFTAEAYDLVLMDIQMPVQDGVSAAQEIRAMAPPRSAVPIVALTANTLAAQVELYYAAGMNDVIAKPIAVAELHAKTLRWGLKGRTRTP